MFTTPFTFMAAPAGGGPILLLDAYPGAAVAFSLRKLSSTYAGSAIRVRRSSDNAEQDIGFVGENLDTSALSTFCSGTDGFVKIWYDQSGNSKNATQTTPSNQTKIVSSGTVNTEGGKPAIISDATGGKNPELALSSSFTFGSAFTVQKSTNLVNNLSYIAGGGGQPGIGTDLNAGFGVTAGSPFLYDGSNIFGTTSSFRNIRVIQSVFQSGGNGTLHVNSSGPFTGSMTLPAFNAILNRGGGANYYPFEGPVQEIVFYSANQISNRVGITSNINAYYSVY